MLFGLAHNPVPGASSFTEACYGANFGFLYMVSGEPDTVAGVVDGACLWRDFKIKSSGHQGIEIDRGKFTLSPEGPCRWFLNAFAAAGVLICFSRNAIIEDAVPIHLPECLTRPTPSWQMSGGNIFVPIVAHIVYDLLTFLEVHNRATAQLQVTLKGRLPEDRKVQSGVILGVLSVCEVMPLLAAGC